jgi:phage tail tape-measure protein
MADVLSGASTGATIGAAAGSIIPGIGTAIGTLIGGLIGGVGGGLMGDRGPEETPMQGKQRELIDQLLAGIRGQGPMANLFSMDENAFQKSFVQPAKSIFQNQIAPQIQQAYVASGQQRGTGLEDTLARAGVNLDQLLNQNYMQFQQGAQNRQLNAMGSILGAAPGVSPQIGYGQAAMQGLGGYMTSDRFGKDIGNVTQSFMNQKDQISKRLIDRKAFQEQIARRKGFDSAANTGLSTMAGQP